MFTGIVEAIGTIVVVTPRGGDVELVIDGGGLSLADACIGDSIAVAGVCLTATRLDGSRFATDVSSETLARTTLGRLSSGSRVNLERALRAGAALGGHYVTGHIDGIARIAERHHDARSIRIVLETPAHLARFIAPKGSVTLEGVSLTVNEVDGNRFGVNLIPHTCAVTTLGAVAAGAALNLEIDIIARYVERLLTASQQDSRAGK
ncbi:MAG TPA: riboflavin synthase [Steroidobacteraceae bacterium]|nr:riboflavin synthase [Steroidobacteraceae bacterium]